MAALPRHPECEDSSQPFSTQYAIRAYLGCVFFVWYAALQQGIKAVLVLHCSISEFRVQGPEGGLVSYESYVSQT